MNETQPTPTDAELKAMWQLHAADIGGIFYYARAVLAKWGTPQPTQPQAGAVPLTLTLTLTEGQIQSLLCKYGYDPDDEQMAAMLKEAHGIKGGQHGTDT